METIHELEFEENVENNDADEGKEKLENKTINVLQMFKMIFVDFWMYSLPLFFTYLFVEGSRSCFVNSVYRKPKSDMRVWLLFWRLSSFTGKSYSVPQF